MSSTWWAKVTSMGKPKSIHDDQKGVSVASKLRYLTDLKNAGTITEEAYEISKKELMGTCEHAKYVEEKGTKEDKDHLKDLRELHRAGTISGEEFVEGKQKLAEKKSEKSSWWMKTT